MKAIIDGKTYNTDTAELIARGDNGHDMGNCWRKTEELYLTKKGRYFIVNENSQIVIVSGDLKLGDEQYRYCNQVGTVHTWLEAWNVYDLDQREIKAFGITEA